MAAQTGASSRHKVRLAALEESRFVAGTDSLPGTLPMAELALVRQA